MSDSSLAYPVSFRGRTLYHLTPLEYAILTRNFEKIQEAVASGAQVCDIDPYTKLTPLHLALAEDIQFLSPPVQYKGASIDIAKWLVQQGADPYAKDVLGQTPDSELSLWEKEKWAFFIQTRLSQTKSQPMR